MKLYEIVNSLALINASIDEAEGELTPDLEASLDVLSMQLSEKVEGISKWILNLSAKEAALEREIERLQMKQRSTGKLQARLKEYVLQCMQRAEITKLEYPAFNARIQKNPPSAEIVEERKIPPKYQIVRVDFDRKALLSDLKEGEDVPGARLKETSYHLRIM